MNVVDPVTVLSLLRIAADLSGYAIPNHAPPIVEETTTVEMQSLTCPHRADCDSIVGLYRDGDMIWVDAEWINGPESKASENSYIVHELTHWLQNQHAWGGSSNCLHVQARETQAYHVQNKYIIIYDHKPAVFGNPDMGCGPHGLL